MQTLAGQRRHNCITQNTGKLIENFAAAGKIAASLLRRAGSV
jgi:hypothetical protein